MHLICIQDWPDDCLINSFICVYRSCISYRYTFSIVEKAPRHFWLSRGWSLFLVYMKLQFLRSPFRNCLHWCSAYGTFYWMCVLCTATRRFCVRLFDFQLRLNVPTNLFICCWWLTKRVGTKYGYREGIVGINFNFHLKRIYLQKSECFCPIFS